MVCAVCLSIFLLPDPLQIYVQQALPNEDIVYLYFIYVIIYTCIDDMYMIYGMIYGI